MDIRRTPPTTASPEERAVTGMRIVEQQRRREMETARVTGGTVRTVALAGAGFGLLANVFPTQISWKNRLGLFGSVAVATMGLGLLAAKLEENHMEWYHQRAVDGLREAEEARDAAS